MIRPRKVYNCKPSMRKIHDWSSLREEFIQGPWLTISTFLEAKRLRNNSYARKMSKGWLKARTERFSDLYARARERVIADEAEIRSRQVKLSRLMQASGASTLSELPVYSADHARRLIVDGMREEREALGLTQHHQKSSLNMTQVNVSLPKTRFDDLIEGMSYEEMLRFLAEIKKEKERRRQLNGTSDEIVTK